jgi:N utilization substance protein B
VARRRDARRLAVAIVFQADVMGVSAAEALEERRSLGERIPRFTEELVDGVAGRLPEIDKVLEEHLQEWTIERLAAVDRAILRVASHELLHREDVPPSVAIDEAVEAAKALSTDDSGRFVNGVLGAIAEDRARAG